MAAKWRSNENIIEENKQRNEMAHGARKGNRNGESENTGVSAHVAKKSESVSGGSAIEEKAENVKISMKMAKEI
jgi:hypothetical protein